MDGIFISYRRDDSAGYAGRLYDRLTAHFGSDRVFMDVEGIEPGTDFVTAIEQAVGSCRVLIVLMGAEWLSLTDQGGRRRLDDPHDFIRLETSTALARDIRVIPVLVEGAAMPRADDLPAELRPLTRRQAIEISHKQWEASTGELIRALEPLLQPAPKPAPPPLPEGSTQPHATLTGPKPVATPEPQPKPIDRPQPAPVAASPGLGGAKRWVLPLAALVALGVATATWRAQDSAPNPPEPAPAAPAKPAARPTPVPTPAPTSTRTPEATPSPAPPPPRIAVDSAALAFPSQTVGTRSELALTVANPGPVAANLGHRKLTGPRATQFALAKDTCDNPLPAGGECRITLAFVPTTAGNHQADLEVPVAGGGATVTVRLTGQAAASTRQEPAPPVAAPAPPVIRAFNARVEGGKATLCYRIDNASSAVLAPRPGKLARADKACVSLALREPTTFSLTAQGPGGSVASPDLEVTPQAPVAEATAIPPPAPATPRADAPAPPATAPGQPRVGETWTYQTRGMWPTSPRRTLQFVVRAVGGGSVTEELSQLKPEGRGPEQKSSRGGEPGFLAWFDIGTEFSPYLGTRPRWTGEESWSNIPTPDFDANWQGWYSTAKITGQETVQVPAGSYTAWKVEAWSSRHATGGRGQMSAEPVRIRYLVWYAPQLARYVRMERKIMAANSGTLEEDVFELAAHRGGP